MSTVLRPMTTGEILDRTFNMYRANFWLFVGIAAVPPALMLVAGLLTVAVAGANLATARAGAPASTAAAGAVVAAIVGAIISAIAYLVGWAVAQGATVYAVSAVHLGRATTIRESYQRVKGKYGRLVLLVLCILLIVSGAAMLLILVAALLGGLAAVLTSAFAVRGGAGAVAGGILMGVLVILAMLAAGVVALLVFARYSLAIPACALEDLRIGPSLKRSAVLSKGSLLKIVAIYILVAVLNTGISFAVIMPIQFLVLAVKSAVLHVLAVIVQQLTSFAVGAIVGPFATIALALVYYDERVRKEAFDIQLMMESITPPAAAPTYTLFPAQSAGQASAAAAGAESAPEKTGEGT
ncbi:MAG: hypothetical protein ACE14L_17310 [Terriglobales bacterium]